MGRPIAGIGRVRMAAEQITYKNINPRTRSIIMVGLILAMMASCFDGTIVGTIGTVIAQDLGGLDLYAWITTAYLLTETIMIPVAGKLSDLYGRKPLFLIGIAIFVVGSILAGQSTSMVMFIACRAIQGLGGGILIPVATAAVADLYAPKDRARMQGIMGAVFGIGNGVGPLLGGYIAEFASWHWCFYINIPLAAAAVILTLKKFPTPIHDECTKIDVKGIALLSLLLLDVILLLEFGGSEFGWVSVETLAMVVLALVLLVLFVMVERKAVNPILAPHLIRNRTVVLAAIMMLVFGIGMIGAMMYTNMFAISVIGLTTLEAGEWSLAMVVGMMITSLSSGALVERTGHKVWLVCGPILCFIGLWYLSGMVVDPEMAVTANAVKDAYMMRYLTGSFVLGLGLGCMMSVVMSAVQNSSRMSEMGMTTSAVNLMRSIGTTMGTAVFSMLINSRLSGELLEYVPSIYDYISHDTGVLEELALYPQYIGEILTAFSNSVDFAFIAGGSILLVVAVLALFFKVGRPEDDPEYEAVKQAIENVEKKLNEE